MKYFYFLIITFCCSGISSCSKNNLDGKWNDNIKLSQKNFVINSDANTITVTTGTKGWWLDNISLDSNQVDLHQINQSDQNFILVEPDFSVERKNGNIIIIKFTSNLTTSNRILIIGLQNGDYFDGIKVMQKPTV